MSTPSLLQRLTHSLRTPAASSSREYSVEALAEAACTTVRNVRAYQDKGLIAPPERRGRVGVYGEEHLARLNLIGQMLERGYSIASIRELLDAWSQGRDLSDVLGLNAAINAPGGPEQSTRLEFGELPALFGDDLNDEIIDRAVELGLVQFAGDHLQVLSPKLLAAGIELYQAGITLPALLDELASISRHVELISQGIVGLIVDQLVNPGADGPLPRADELDALGSQLQRLRPLVEQVVDAELARSLPVAVNRELTQRLNQLAQRVAPIATKA